VPVDRHPNVTSISEAAVIRAAIPIALVLAYWFTACAPSSSGEENKPIAYRGIWLERRLVRTPFFAHYAFAKSGCAGGSEQAIPVFLEGDGNSWIRDGVVSEDPTPADPIALDLLVADQECGLYVSRPCTFGMAAVDARCGPSVWTLDRYSSDVVESLASVVEQVVPAGRPILLVGYSGGGLLASHLANRLRSVSGLITVAANLDLPVWVAHHHFAPELVARSLPSPFPIRKGVVALHVFGDRDAIAPVSLATGVLAGDSLVLAGIDHTCCWPREWPRIRAAFQQRSLSSSRRRASSALR
jgi:pimeloyl-ACP methyl ester carboxylesterase